MPQVVRAAMRHWTNGDGTTDMGTLVDTAFAVVASALSLAAVPR